ncbi:MAG: DUF4838 domain-containing protein, partial [Lentisphaerae bacterium]|nr:DUF4838 domain-containing protein [Lentisphaerota bacterium]
HGSFNAVVDFLRSQGVRRYMRGELGVVMPEKSTIALPRVNKTVRPDFPVRYAYEHGHRGDTLWQLWMGFNPAADIQGIAYNFHGISEITKTSGNPLIDGEKPEEYYALFGGKREIGGKQCLSSEKLFEANVKYVRALFDVFDEPMVSVMPSDSYQSLCQCEKCAGKSDTEREHQGRLSNYVWDYVNRIAQEVYKTHPERKIVCLAYGANRLPPTNIEQFSPNVVVSIVQHRRNFAYDPDAFEHTLALRRGFLDLLPGEGPRLLQDDHYRMTFGVPGFYMQSIVKDLRSLKGVSLGDFLDIDNDRDCQGIRHLNKYITGRFWWDADQDLDAMLDEYYEKFYGPARAEMQAFIEYSEANWPGMINNQESIETARRLLAAAQARVEPDSVYGQRVALVAANIKPLTYRANQLARARPDAPLQLMAERSDQAVIFDGKLDDPIWKVGARKFSGRLRDADGSQTRTQTRYIPVWSSDTLYIGIHCQGLPKTVTSQGADEQDQPDIQYDETIDILLETQTHSYYQISVNPAGILTDASYEDGTPEFAWSSNAQVATHIGEDYWSAEFRIPIAGREQREVDPLDGVSGFMPTHAHPWYFNVCLQRGSGEDRQIMSFSPTGDDIHNSDRFGRMVRHHLAQPR